MAPRYEWFRMYSEARTDAKLDALTDAEHRVWHRLMCFASDQPVRGMIQGYDLDLLAVEVAKGDAELLSATVERLARLRVVTADAASLTFINWEKRQYDKPSDLPDARAQRKREERARSRGVTPESRDVTRCHTIDEDEEPEGESEPELAASAAPAREAVPVEFTVAERKVIATIQQVKGMASVPETDIGLHLRDVLMARGGPLTDAALELDALRFRDHWNDKRQTSAVNERWRGWRSAMTNWFSRTTEAPTFTPRAPKGNGSRPADAIPSYGDPGYESYKARQKALMAGKA